MLLIYSVRPRPANPQPATCIWYLILVVARPPKLVKGELCLLREAGRKRESEKAGFIFAVDVVIIVVVVCFVFCVFKKEMI